MSQFKVCLILIFHFLLFCEIYSVDENTCYPVGLSSKPDLTTYTFFHNIWNEVNRTGTDLDEGTTCGYFWYDHAPALPGDPELIALEHRYNESDHKHDFVVFGNATVSGNITTLNIQFPTDSVSSNYFVLGTDYDWYALVYACAQETTQRMKERMWILTRRDFNRYNNTVIEEQLKKPAEILSKLEPEFQERAKKLLKPCA